MLAQKKDFCLLFFFFFIYSISMDGDEGKKMVRASRPTNISDIEGSDVTDEEPGEVIESAPPLKVGEEREISASGLILKKKLLKSGRGWETLEPFDEVTVHYVGTALDGSKITSTRHKGEPFTFKVGNGTWSSWKLLKGYYSIYHSSARILFKAFHCSWVRR